MPPALLAALLLAAPAPQSPTDGCPGDYVFFASDSATLDSRAIDRLDRSLPWLREVTMAGGWIHLRGGTDELGSPRYNLALSRRRAESVRRYFLAHGVGPGALRIEAAGETQPLAAFDGSEPADSVRAQNRFVNFAPEMPRAVFQRFFPGDRIC